MRSTDSECAVSRGECPHARRNRPARWCRAVAFVGAMLLPVTAHAQASTLPGLFGGTVRSLAQNGSTFYAGSGGHGVYSSATGTSWTSFSDATMSTQTVLALAVDAVPSTHLVLAGTSNGGVFKAGVGTPTWTAANGNGDGALTNLTVSALGVDPAGNVYAGTAAGLFATTFADLGTTTWTVIPGITGAVSSIAVVNGNRIYVGSGTSIIATVNGFATVTSHNLGQAVNTLVVKGGANANGSADALYVGTDTGVFISTNGGGAWGTAQTVGLGSRKILSLALDGTNNRLFAGEDTGGIFIAAPSGSTAMFAPAASGLPCAGLSPPCPSSPANGAILALLVNPGGSATSDIVLAGTGNGSVFRTANSGSGWSSAGSGIPFGVKAISGGFESPGKATMEIAVTDRNVFKLAHGATSWTLELVPATTSINTVTSNPSTGRIYVGVNGSTAANVFTIDYTSGSPTWQSFQSIPGADVTALANDGQGAPATYVGTAANFIAQCVNAVPAADGSDCTAYAAGGLNRDVHAIALDANLHAWAATDGGMITLGGGTWAADTMPGAPTVPIRSLAVAQSGPTAPLILFAGTDTDVRRRGTTWAVLSGLALTGAAQALLAEPTGDVFVGTAGNGIQHSADFGTTWSDFSTGLPANSGVTALALSGTVIYAGTATGGTFAIPAPASLAVPENAASLPAAILLQECSPNPARASTTVRFALPSATTVTISIYDLDGRRVAQPLDRVLQQPGLHDIPVRSAEWRPGVYFCHLAAAGHSAVRKVVVLR